MWDLKSGKIKTIFQNEKLVRITSNPNGTVVCFWDEECEELDIFLKKFKKIIKIHKKPIFTPAISPLGDGLALELKQIKQEESWFQKLSNYLGIIPVRHQKQTEIFELPNGGKIAELDGACAPRFSPDGKYLAVAYQNQVYLYDFPFRTPWGKISFFFVFSFAITSFFLKILKKINLGRLFLPTLVLLGRARQRCKNQKK